MKGYIGNVDWYNMEAMRYWSFPKSYSDEKKKNEAHNAIFGGDYIGALKVDGYYERIVKDDEGNVFMIARDRNVHDEVVNKIEWVPQFNDWFAELPNGTCLLCELYWPHNEGSRKITTILGCLKDKAISRQKENGWLHLYAFDIMAYNGENYNKTSYEKRGKILREVMPKYPSPFVEYAEYFEGKELWSHLQEYLASGREGMVIMRKDAVVYNKRTPAHISIKMKKELKDTIDCFFTGHGTAPTHEYKGKEIKNWVYWENTITGKKELGEYYNDYKAGRPFIPVTKGWFYGWFGSLEIAVLKKKEGSQVVTDEKTYEGYEVFHLGYLSGVSEELKTNPKKFAFRPMEVTAMEYDAIEHTLRHGKMVGWRDDITLEQCTFDKIK